MKRVRRASLPNPYHEILRELVKANVEFLVIGVSGINYFAKDARQILSTADYDLFLRPTPENLARAWQAFRKGGFTIAVRNRDHMRVPQSLSAKAAKNLAKQKRTLVGEGPYRILVEGLLAVSGFTFDEMQRKSVQVSDPELGFKFRVGHLSDLLESKRQANREKDRHFLARYKRLLLGDEE